MLPPPVSTPWQMARYVRLISRRSSAGAQRRVARQRARDEQQAARVLVEPVDETGARQHRKLGVAMQQRVLQRARAIAGAGVHDEADGLVDDEQRVVGMDDGERDRLGSRFDGRFELGLERELLAAFEQQARLGARGPRPSAHRHRSRRAGGSARTRATSAAAA